MRIWGWVFLILGIVFLFFFVFAQAGGGSIGVMPWLVAGFLCLIGLNFIRSGGGLVRATPAVTIADAGTAISAPAMSGEVGTVEVPMSPAAVQAIKRSARWRLRVVSYVAAGMGLFFITTGPIQVADWMYGGTLGGGFGKKGTGQLLRLADRAFLVTPAESMALSKIPRGTVDYGARGHVILAAWDEHGNSVFSAPGYTAPALP